MAQFLAKARTFGLDAPDPDDDTAYLWPENVAAWSAFLDLQTQWHISMAGATGMPASWVLADLQERYPDRAERLPIYLGVRACERAVLNAWAERREREHRAAAKG